MFHDEGSCPLRRSEVLYIHCYYHAIVCWQVCSVHVSTLCSVHCTCTYIVRIHITSSLMNVPVLHTSRSEVLHTLC